MADFHRADLSGSRFDEVDLSGSTFRASDLRGTEFRGVALHHARFIGVELGHVEITGELLEVTVNGVKIGPLVEAELDRRYPDRPMMRPTDADGFRAAWAILGRRWAETVERAQSLEPDRLHVSVRGEWSFIETLRHLAFATDSWVSRVILGDPSPWDPLDLPWDEMSDIVGVPRDRSVRPRLDEVLRLRQDRVALVGRVLDGLTDADLDAVSAPLAGPGWPPEGATFTTRECLLIVLNEEWEHRLYAERDLDALESDR